MSSIARRSARGSPRKPSSSGNGEARAASRRPPAGRPAPGAPGHRRPAGGGAPGADATNDPKRGSPATPTSSSVPGGAIRCTSTLSGAWPASPPSREHRRAPRSTAVVPERSSRTAPMSDLRGSPGASALTATGPPGLRWRARPPAPTGPRGCGDRRAVAVQQRLDLVRGRRTAAGARSPRGRRGVASTPSRVGRGPAARPAGGRA